MARWALGLGLPKRAKAPAKVHLPIPSQGCAKMETQLQITKEKQWKHHWANSSPN
jgi:hypothetical protein